MNLRKVLAVYLLVPAFLTPGANALNNNRHSHTSTLLPDGNILITGGTLDPAAVTDSVEMYDMASNTYINWVGGLVTARSSHTATLMSDGRVLIAGGFNASGQPMTSLELCDPRAAVRTCAAAGVSMLTARGGHTATLLSVGPRAGQVLLCGGQSGNAETTITETCETFNPSGPAIAAAAPMVSTREGHAAVLLRSGKVFVTGGRRWTGAWLYEPMNELYDPSTGVGVWTPVSALLQGRINHTATVLNSGIIMIAGGYNEVNGLYCKGKAGSTEDECWHIKYDPLNVQDVGNHGYLDGAEFYDQNGARVVIQESTYGEIPYRVAQHSAMLEPDGKWRIHGGYGNIYPTFFDGGAKVQAGSSVQVNVGGCVGPDTNGNTTCTLLPASILDIMLDFNLSRAVSGRLVDSDIFTAASTPGVPSFSFPYMNDQSVSVFISANVTTLDGQPVGLHINDDAAPGDFKNIIRLQNPAGIAIFSSAVVSPITVPAETDYNHPTSTVVVRGMVLSSQLSYVPKTNTWGDLTCPKESPAMSEPAFNHTALLTPAADTVILGGHNCEANPPVDCLRAVKTFSASTVDSIFIPVHKDSWPAGAKLNVKRAFHTSTVLPDGDILTCGGSNGVITLNSCELYDTAERKWIYVSSMAYARANHTATLLPNGNVLAAGGITAGLAVTSAEIYYPGIRRWVPTSSMADPRQLHTATLMPDGNVLVTGGATLSTYSATAEIYISSTAQWLRANGTMVNGRSQHTATLLKNGNVLITGGVNGLGAMTQTEVYNYLNRTFAAGPPLNFARYAHTANQLRDGNVIAIGGSDGIDSMRSCEIYNGASWTVPLDAFGDPVSLNYNRANHRSVLLPNGKIILTGGEMSGVAQAIPEGFDPDYRNWSHQGTASASGRTHHTMVLTRDNYVISIGGWSGGQYLDGTEYVHFNINQDSYGLDAETARPPVISTGANYFNQGAVVTLLSDTSNFHGISEASGGGAGAANSSHHNPRVYMQQIDNPSGFMIDLSTRIYSLYGGGNANWEKTLSSITVIMPSPAGELPHGWYHMRAAANGQFSEGHIVQVTIPRPSGMTTIPLGSVQGATSVQWTWDQNTLNALENDGYAVFASSDDVFIATVTFGASVTYDQTGLAPNTATGIKVGGYNSGGYSAFQKSTTYYTLAVAPQNLAVDEASFETARLSWDPMGNSALTIYEVSMSLQANFLPAEDVFVPEPFNNAHTSTSTTINQLKPNQTYYFRVRAMNMDGIVTAYDQAYLDGTPVSTVTVGGINNLAGTPLTMSSINWSWDPSEGADFYEVYDITAGTTPSTSIFVGSTTLNSLDQVHLSTNTAYKVAVRAIKDTATGPVQGPISISDLVYTLAVQPLPGVPSAFTNVTTDSLTLNWIANGNNSSTTYRVMAATDADYTSLVYSSEVQAVSVTLTGLTPNTQYYAGIIALNGAGQATTPLSLGSAYTRAQAPTGFKPTDIAMSGVSLTWETGANPANTPYEVRGTTVPGFTINITTPVPFARLSTANSLTLNGLLTATTYYFDVAAMNGAGFVTARTQAVPAACTLPGPGGAPLGSLGGTSLPKTDVTIEGILPNGRKVSLFIPSGAFESQTSIAISQSVTDPCIRGAIPLVEVAIYSQDTAQPQIPVTLKLDYTAAEAGAGITSNRTSLVLARHNPVSGECLPLETRIDPCFAVEGRWDRCITANLNHFSVFQLMVKTAAANLNAVRAYPNPFYTNQGQGFVTIDGLPASAKVRIYTLSGDKVWEGAAGTTGVLTWSAVNDSGVLVGSGVYLAAIESSAGKKVIKIAVER